MSVALPSGPRRRGVTWRSGRASVEAVRWATIAAVLLAWEVICRGPLSGSGYLVGPVEVVRHGLPHVIKAEPMALLGHTMLRFVIAFVIAAAVGSALGLSMGRLHRQLFLGSRDVVTVLYALPLVPFYPLFVLWLGLGSRSEIAFGAIHGAIPVILLTMSASANVPAGYLDSGRAMGAGRVQRLTALTLPAVVPDLVGALKIGGALTLLGVLLAELMISVNGVGSFVAAQIANQQAATLDAMVLLVCVVAVLLNIVLGAVEGRLGRWRPTSP